MAGIIKRFTDIMSANVNALLDKAEDPAKMIDQCLRDMESDMGKVKAETAAVMAEETRAKRALNECAEEIDKMQAYAKRALQAGNENDAREFLAQKQKLTEKQTTLQAAYTAAAENAAKMRSMHDKLAADIRDLNSRRDAIKAKLAVAKTQEKLNKIGGSMAGVADHMSAFDRMEAKADQMLDEANAMAALNEATQKSGVEDLMSKYDAQPSDEVDDALARLKAEMGL